jgi:hypothetical protein
MNFVATVAERVLTEITWVAMHVVIVSERWQRRLPRHIRRWGGSVRRIWRQWLRARSTETIASMSAAAEPGRVGRTSAVSRLDRCPRAGDL